MQSKFWESSKEKWEVNQRSNRMHMERQLTVQAAGVEPQCGMDGSGGLCILRWMEQGGQVLSARAFP